MDKVLTLQVFVVSEDAVNKCTDNYLKYHLLRLITTGVFIGSAVSQLIGFTAIGTTNPLASLLTFLSGGAAIYTAFKTGQESYKLAELRVRLYRDLVMVNNQDLAAALNGVEPTTTQPSHVH